MNPLAPAVLDERKLFARSSLQVALLTFFTQELYVFFWSYFVLRSAKALLEDESEQPVWWSIALVVPLLGFFAIFRLFDRIKVLALRAQLAVPQALGALGLLWVAGVVLSRFASYEIASLAMLLFIPLAYAQLFVERAELELSGFRSTPRRFTWVEIAVLAIGALWRLLVLRVYLFDEEMHLREMWWFPVCVLVVAAFAAWWLARESRAGLERMTAGLDGSASVAY